MTAHLLFCQASGSVIGRLHGCATQTFGNSRLPTTFSESTKISCYLFPVAIDGMYTHFTYRRETGDDELLQSLIL